MQYQKVYVTVEVLVRSDGATRPQRILWNDENTYFIDRILHITPAASLKVGGRGIRYTVIIEGKERHLFYEDGRWFVEAKQN